MRFANLTRRATGALAVLVLAACSERTPTEPRLTEAELYRDASQSMSRHVFVLVEEDIPSRELREEITRRGGILENAYEFGVLTVLGLDDEAAGEVASRDDVDGVNRDMMVHWVPGFDEVVGEVMQAPEALSDQSGAFYYGQGMQWNISQVGADVAWGMSGQGAGQVVAVLDTGTDPNHIDLAGKIHPSSVSVLTPGSSPCGAADEQTINDYYFHGTFVSGLVSSNGLGMASVAPDASIMAVKVLNCDGSGSFADIIAGITYAAQQRADVINMSLGAYFSIRDPGAWSLVKATMRAVAYATLKGSVVVAAAGNDGINLDADGDFIVVPGQLPLVISVGATAPVAQMDFDQLTTYTNYGVTGVTLMAPGGDLVAGGVCGFAPTYRCDLVISTLSSFLPGVPGPNFYAASGGTSFAAPHVAGAVAVVESTGRHFAGVCVVKGADDLGARGLDPLYGFGRLNVVGALDCGRGGHGTQD